MPCCRLFAACCRPASITYASNAAKPSGGDFYNVVALMVARAITQAC